MGYSIIFWVLAAICCSVCDTLAHHYYTSVFYKKKEMYKSVLKWNLFWDIELSNKYPIYIPLTKYKVDAWHLFKSAGIVLQALAILAAWIDHPPFLNVWWFYLTMFIFMGIAWNMTFNLFYNWLLKKSTWN